MMHYNDIRIRLHETVLCNFMVMSWSFLVLINTFSNCFVDLENVDVELWNQILAEKLLYCSLRKISNRKFLSNIIFLMLLERFTLF